mgnify:FL=1
MNRLLIGIAQRLAHKAIKVNTEKYNIQVAYKFISKSGVIVVTIFNGEDNYTYWFYDSWIYTDKKQHINQFRCILRKIRKRVL